MPAFLRDFPLTGASAPWILSVLGLVVAVTLVAALPRRQRLTILATAVVVAAVLSAVCVTLIVVGFQVPRGEIPTLAILGGGYFIACVLLAGFAVADTWRKVWTIVPLSASLVIALLLTNQAFSLYPMVSTLAEKPGYVDGTQSSLPSGVPSVPVEKWKPTGHLPARGTLVEARPPATQSGFNARSAHVYLPPAWFSNPRPQLPVLVLLHGVPGNTRDWFRQGLAAQVADDYQRTHHGLAPIIAAVDSTGDRWESPECTVGAPKNVNTYLAQDIPRWLHSTYNASTDQSRWTIGGLSYGGTCALEVVTSNPSAYGSFLSFSGEKTAAASTDLRERAYPHIAGRFYAGSKDPSAISQLKAQEAETRAAGMQTSFGLIPGGHSYEVWRPGLRQAFGFVIARAHLPR